MEIWTRIENKLDRIDDKLDNHLGRISRVEESMTWLKGHVKITITVTITIIGGLIGVLSKYIIS